MTSFTAGEIASRVVVVAEPETTVGDAARLMRDNHVGALVVIEPSGAREKAIGIVTDRDLVIEVLAMGLDPGTITVGDIMASDLATIAAESSAIDAAGQMRTRGVRRLPVLDRAGRVVGIVALDDLFAVLSTQLSDIAQAVHSERDRERKTRAGLATGA